MTILTLYCLWWLIFMSDNLSHIAGDNLILLLVLKLYLTNILCLICSKTT